MEGRRSAQRAGRRVQAAGRINARENPDSKRPSLVPGRARRHPRSHRRRPPGCPDDPQGTGAFTRSRRGARAAGKATSRAELSPHTRDRPVPRVPQHAAAPFKPTAAGLRERKVEAKAQCHAPTSWAVRMELTSEGEAAPRPAATPPPRQRGTSGPCSPARAFPQRSLLATGCRRPAPPGTRLPARSSAPGRRPPVRSTSHLRGCRDRETILVSTGAFPNHGPTARTSQGPSRFPEDGPHWPHNCIPGGETSKIFSPPGRCSPVMTSRRGGRRDREGRTVSAWGPPRPERYREPESRQADHTDLQPTAHGHEILKKKKNCIHTLPKTHQICKISDKTMGVGIYICSLYYSLYFSKCLK